MFGVRHDRHGGGMSRHAMGSTSPVFLEQCGHLRIAARSMVSVLRVGIFLSRIDVLLNPAERILAFFAERRL